MPARVRVSSTRRRSAGSSLRSTNPARTRRSARMLAAGRPMPNNSARGPAWVVGGGGRKDLFFPPPAAPTLPRRTGDVNSRFRHPLVELGPHELEDRALGPRDAVALHRRDRAVAVQLQRARFDGVHRDLLAHQRIRSAAELAGMVG